uniref:Uncharacterized protein n=1 Tax=Arundo donax TaxID=35708 RepID=A0A0A9DYA9_ARUDO
MCLVCKSAGLSS